LFYLGTVSAIGEDIMQQISHCVKGCLWNISRSYSIEKVTNNMPPSHVPEPEVIEEVESVEFCKILRYL